MAFFERGDVAIYHEVHGEGFPVLAIAPGGMRSTLERWKSAPWDPTTALSDRYRVIAMDQRNAGRSTAPVRATDGWDTYTDDQLALLDHLGVDDFAVVGMCIGGPYIMGMLRAAPERVRAAVVLQPIGVDDNRRAFFDLFEGWAAEIADVHPEADDATWAAFAQNMFGGEFLFNASEEEVASARTPILLLMGDDLYHPRSISRRFAELAPRVTVVERWKDEPDRAAAVAAIDRFLDEHTSGRA